MTHWEHDDESNDSPEQKEQEQLAAMEHGITGRNDAAGSSLGQAGYCPHCLKDYGSGHHCCDC